MTEIIVLILQEPQTVHIFEKHRAKLQTPWAKKFFNFHNAFVSKAVDVGKEERGKE